MYFMYYSLPVLVGALESSMSQVAQLKQIKGFLINTSKQRFYYSYFSNKFYNKHNIQIITLNCELNYIFLVEPTF